MKRLLWCGMTWLVLNGTLTSLALPQSPTAILKAYSERVKAVAKGSGAQAEKDKKLSELMAEMFDFETLARNTLMTWGKLSPEKQAEFSRLFKALVQKTYIAKTNRYLADLNLVFDGEALTGDAAKVTCLVKQDDVDIEIVYQMRRKKGTTGWKVVNVVIDGSSLTRNYRSQFSRFLKDNSLNELLETMRKKASEG